MAAADATTTLRVGSFVLANDFRHPALVAREAATVDLLTDGRFELGLGAGHMRWEYDEVGIPFVPAGDRVGRLEESVQIVRQLLDGEAVRSPGEHYEISGHRSYPPRPQVPLLVGGNGNRVLALGRPSRRHRELRGLPPGRGQRRRRTQPLPRRQGSTIDSRSCAPRPAIASTSSSSTCWCSRWWSPTTGPARPRSSAARSPSSPRKMRPSPRSCCSAPTTRSSRRCSSDGSGFGISYVVVFGAAMDALAPVVDRLRGR